MVVRGSEHSGQLGFAATVRAVVERMCEVSGADLIALYPYDEETDSFYAPAAIGMTETDVVHALPDLTDQLRRFRADQAQGKTPDDLLPSHYGPSAYLIATRRPLVSADAAHEVDGSFVRRHKIHAILGTPLLVGGRVVGLLYLNYVAHSEQVQQIDVTLPDYLRTIEHTAAESAIEIDRARHDEELLTLRAVSKLVTDFTSLPEQPTSVEGGRLRLETALERIVLAAQLDAAALYVPDLGGSRLALLAAHGCPQLATQARSLPVRTPDELLAEPVLSAALECSNLSPVAGLTLQSDNNRAVLVLAGHDPLALQRRLPVTQTLLHTAADLLGALLHNSRLQAAMDESNRTLGAVTRLGNRLLQPGASIAQVLRTAVETLTDPALPELDFEFADIYLLNSLPDGALTVEANAGATNSPSIDSVEDAAEPRGAAGTRRIPRWVTQGMRTVDRRDVLNYVATHGSAVVVGALDADDDDRFVTGYPEDRLDRIDIPVTGSEGTPTKRVHAARLLDMAGHPSARLPEGTGTGYRPSDEITLDADFFSAYGHASLVRVFVPFGMGHNQERATGVLEVGYHLSHKTRLERVQIEALRACATTIAVAVETARLYEDVTTRARQLETVTEVSRVIASSIDMEQTLNLVARNMARAVDASIGLIALLEEDGSAWYGAASSESEEVWRSRRVERPESSIVFEVADTGRPLVVEDALNHPLVSNYFAHLLGVRSLMALPLTAGESGAIGAVLLAQRDRARSFTLEEVERASGIAGQAAMAIWNARLHAREEEEHHIQKDVVLIGFGQWGQKAYQHLVLLKSFFNFRTHVVEVDRPGRRAVLQEVEQAVLANGDLFYWDSPETPARAALAEELEPSCYVITYIATPAETHLPVLKSYYDLSNVVLIEKPLGAPPEEYRAFLDHTDGLVQIVAADHYWFKIEVRLLELLLTEERNLRAFLDDIEEVEIEILEEQPPGGSGAQIGMIADLIPHAFAVLSLLTPLDRLKLAEHQPLQVGRYEPLHSEHETYARLTGTFDHRGRPVRVTIDVGKGVTSAKWIKLSGERRMGGRRPFYKFDFLKGEAIDGTQSALRAATRPIRQSGVPDNAHLSMLRHVIDKKHPAVGILSIREALRANARIQQLERMAMELIASGQWTPYTQGQPPAFTTGGVVNLEELRQTAGQTSHA